MVFKDTTTKLGLIEDCEVALFGDNGYGKISGDTNKLYQFTGRINRRQDKFVKLAYEADGTWQYDDTNHVDGSGNPDFPEATTTIVSGQRDYTLSTSMLEIEKVLIYPNASTTKYQVIEPADIQDREDNSIVENDTTTTGTPYRYDKKGNTIILDPIPNYNASLGLKVIFKRGPKYFVYTDTTAQPGFPSIFHQYLSRGSSLDYAIDRTMTANINNLAVQVAEMEKDIKKFFSRRTLDEPKGVTMEPISFM